MRALINPRRSCIGGSTSCTTDSRMFEISVACGVLAGALIRKATLRTPASLPCPTDVLRTLVSMLVVPQLRRSASGRTLQELWGSNELCPPIRYMICVLSLCLWFLDMSQQSTHKITCFAVGAPVGFTSGAEIREGGNTTQAQHTLRSFRRTRVIANALP